MTIDKELVDALKDNIREKEKLLKMQDDRITMLCDTIRKLRDFADGMVKIANLEVKE
jgi:hypothetical protein